jgi:hypothetical protein
MLAGRNDIKFVKLFNSRMAQYSDDAVTQPAAYGHRWRNHFGTDQLEFVIGELKKSPTSRRAVMTMADPVADVEAVLHGGADVPCNTGVYFIIRTSGHLDMTVTCRSNDAIWGCYGANAVHMSILHEYVAARIGASLGTYYQVSNDLHAYTDIFSVTKLKEMVEAQMPQYAWAPMMLNRGDVDMTKFDADLETFFYLFDEGKSDEIDELHFVSAFFALTVAPMFRAWMAYKSKDRAIAGGFADVIACPAWRNACVDWLNNAWTKKDAA